MLFFICLVIWAIGDVFDGLTKPQHERSYIIPELVKKGSKYYVSCCYWNNWTGLNREVVEITIENNMVKEIEVIETYNLIKYHCWILY